MAWVAPMTFVSNTVLTAAQMNIYVRDNLNETAPAKATTPGYWFISQGPNSIAERAIVHAKVSAGETTTETTFSDLTTVGPAVTCTTGTKAMWIISSQTHNLTSDRATYMNVEITGASTISPDIENSYIVDGLNQTQLNTHKSSTVYLETGLTPGTNTFTTKYMISTGTGYWSRRQLIVMAL